MFPAASSVSKHMNPRGPTWPKKETKIKKKKRGKEEKTHPVVDRHDNDIVPSPESLSAHPDLRAAVEGASVHEEHHRQSRSLVSVWPEHSL